MRLTRSPLPLSSRGQTVSVLTGRAFHTVVLDISSERLISQGSALQGTFYAVTVTVGAGATTVFPPAACWFLPAGLEGEASGDDGATRLQPHRAGAAGPCWGFTCRCFALAFPRRCSSLASAEPNWRQQLPSSSGTPDKKRDKAPAVIQGERNRAPSKTSRRCLLPLTHGSFSCECSGVQRPSGGGEGAAAHKHYSEQTFPN